MTTPAAALDREIVEHVAAAIYAVDPLCSSKLTWDERPDRERKHWRRMAVAAVEAMRAHD